MYDFHFGDTDFVRENEIDFLIFIKHMLPRWCNSIPDSEFIAIHRLLEKLQNHSNDQILVETGAGASTIVLLNHAMKYNKTLYSWDINATKCAYLRGVINDTLSRHYDVNLWNYWKFIPYNSLSADLGIPIIKEMEKKVSFCFLDSEHTLDVLLGELELLTPNCCDETYITIDDANYTYRHKNVSYINMQRKKINLPPINDTAENRCQEFYKEVQQFLQKRWSSVLHIEDSYKLEHDGDVYWKYYESDRKVMGLHGMEKMNQRSHRFDAWHVKERKA